jgi:hypothetical protein
MILTCYDSNLRIGLLLWQAEPFFSRASNHMTKQNLIFFLENRLSH